MCLTKGIQANKHAHNMHAPICPNALGTHSMQPLSHTHASTMTQHSNERKANKAVFHEMVVATATVLDLNL